MIQEHHWALWAKRRRDPDGVYLGFPRENVLWTPTRIQESELDAGKHELTQDDEHAADLIGLAVAAYTDVDLQGVKHLVTWFGAYEGAPRDRGQRIVKMGIPRSRAYEVIAKHRGWCEGWTHCFSSLTSPLALSGQMEVDSAIGS